MRTLLLMILLCLPAATVFAQRYSIAQHDSVKKAEYREKIGLDMTVANFETTSVDETVMGPRLARLIEFFNRKL